MRRHTLFYFLGKGLVYQEPVDLTFPFFLSESFECASDPSRPTVRVEVISELAPQLFTELLSVFLNFTVVALKLAWSFQFLFLL